MFIDARKEVTRKNAQSYLEDTHIEKIASCYSNYCEVPGFSAIATIDEIIGNEGSLHIPLYVERIKVNTDIPSVADATAEWIVSTNEVNESLNALNKLLGGDNNA